MFPFLLRLLCLHFLFVFEVYLVKKNSKKKKRKKRSKKKKEDKKDKEKERVLVRSFFLQVLRWRHGGKVILEMTPKVMEARFEDECF